MDTITIKRSDKVIIPIKFKRTVVINTTVSKKEVENIITPKPTTETVTVNTQPG